MRRMLGALSIFAFAPLALAQSVFINEIHYDNTGADSGEAIEIAGPAGTDLTGWSIVLYNGSTPAAAVTYDTDALSGTLTDQCGGFGFAVLNYPSNGIQNGAPDGLALVNNGTVVQFLSYEGVMTASNGPASGMVSVDIGVSEPGTGAVGNSLQLSGTGNSYDDFTWQPEAANTFSACNTGQTFDTTPPSVISSEPAVPSPSALATVTIQLTFSEPVDGVDLSDLALSTTGVAGASLADVGPTGALPSATWNVDVNTGTGDGTIRVDVLDDDSIVDAVGNPLNGAFSAGTAIAIDKTPPTVLSVALNSANPTNAATVDYLVTFSEDVTGVDTADFAITEFNGLTGSTVNAVSGSGAVWTVTVNTGGTAGDLRLDVVDDDSIVDAANNPLNGGFTGGDIATIDKIGPTVTINQAMGQADPTSTSPVLFTVVFSESVSTFATGDVTLSGTAGATTADVTGAGDTYTVSVSGMTANGTVIANLDVGAATDALSNPSAASTSTDNTVTFNNPAPTVVSIVRNSASPTTSPTTVVWTVTFSEAVTGVDASDFALISGPLLIGANITSVTGSGTTWTVTADSGTGGGSLDIDLIDDDSIIDALNSPLGGVGAGNGNFTAGQGFVIINPLAARPIPTLSQLGLLLTALLVLIGGGLSVRRYS